MQRVLSGSGFAAEIYFLLGFAEQQIPHTVRANGFGMTIEWSVSAGT